jgi:hypothetical protein
MYIENAILDLLISKLTIEYSGTHNSDTKNPLWGRCAYWRVFAQDQGFVCKITTPVKCINPRPETLKKLFRAELKKRFESIHERFTSNHYGEMHLEYRDPYGVKPLLKLLERKYYDLELKKVGA